MKSAQEALRASTLTAQAALAAEQVELDALRPRIFAARPAVLKLRSDADAARAATAEMETETAELLKQLEVLRSLTGVAPAIAVSPTARPRLYY